MRFAARTASLLFGVAFLCMVGAVPAQAQQRTDAPGVWLKRVLRLGHTAPVLARPLTQSKGAAPEREIRFWPTARAGLLGGVVGGGLGLLIGDIEFNTHDRTSRRGVEYEEDDDGARIPAAIPGVWLGSTIGALAGAQVDIASDETMLWVAGGSALLGGVMGGSFGIGLGDGRA